MEQSFVLKEQFCGIDIGKFFAAITVVAIHTVFPYQIGVLFRWAVPFFFITSSFLFFHKKKLYKDFAKRLLILYCVWFVLEIPLVWQRFAGQGFLQFIRSLFFDNTFYASWYLVASIEAMGLCVLLSRWLNNKLLLLLGIVMYFFPLAVGAYYGFLPEGCKDILLSIDEVLPLTRSFVFAFIFIVLGKIISDNIDKMQISTKWVKILLLLTVVAYFMETMVLRPYCLYYNTFLSLPLLAVLMLVYAIRFNCRLTPQICSFLRKASILIYLIHPVALLFLPRFSFASSAINLALRFTCAVVISLALSYLIIVGSKRYKVLSYLY